MSTKYECPSTIDIVEVDDEWIIMDTEKFTITKLNPIGAFILEEIKKDLHSEEIIERISMIYTIDKSIVKTDVQAFLEDLERIGLIKNER